MDDKYIVVKNDKPQTGPLSRETAERVAADIGRGAKVEPVETSQEKPFPFGLLFGILVGLAIVAGIVAGIITGDWGTSITVAIYGFFGALVMSIWVIISSSGRK